MGVYNETLTKEYIQEIKRASPLHDIGKIDIPDNVLFKTGRLTTEEFTIIKTHSSIGFRALHSAREQFMKNDFFNIACDIALYHHEKWDGSGYPKGLKGNNIPLSARIMALSDVYDALVSKRVYKDAIKHTDAKQMITEEQGKHFDPIIVDAFLISERLFEKIAFQSKKGN